MPVPRPRGRSFRSAVPDRKTAAIYVNMDCPFNIPGGVPMRLVSALIKRNPKIASWVSPFLRNRRRISTLLVVMSGALAGCNDSSTGGAKPQSYEISIEGDFTAFRAPPEGSGLDSEAYDWDIGAVTARVMGPGLGDSGFIDAPMWNNVPARAYSGFVTLNKFPGGAEYSVVVRVFDKENHLTGRSDTLRFDELAAKIKLPAFAPQNAVPWVKLSANGKDELAVKAKARIGLQAEVFPFMGGKIAKMEWGLGRGAYVPTERTDTAFLAPSEAIDSLPLRFRITDEVGNEASATVWADILSDPPIVTISSDREEIAPGKIPTWPGATILFNGWVNMRVEGVTKWEWSTDGGSTFSIGQADEPFTFILSDPAPPVTRVILRVTDETGVQGSDTTHLYIPHTFDFTKGRDAWNIGAGNWSFGTGGVAFRSCDTLLPPVGVGCNSSYSGFIWTDEIQPARRFTMAASITNTEGVGRLPLPRGSSRAGFIFGVQDSANFLGYVQGAYSSEFFQMKNGEYLTLKAMGGGYIGPIDWGAFKYLTVDGDSAYVERGLLNGSSGTNSQKYSAPLPPGYTGGKFGIWAAKDVVGFGNLRVLIDE
jgi:hypothetical protein